MKTTTKVSRFEFSFPQLDTLVQVEESEGEIVIRATRDTFTEARRASFIRELATEGFIPDQYRWAQLTDYRGASGVRWLIDHSWLKPNEAMVARTRRFMVRLLLGAGVLWLLLMTWLLLKA